MIYRFGNFDLDTRLDELRRDDVPVSIVPQAFDVLRLLIENRDRLVRKDEMIEKIWEGRIVSEATLSSSINAARRAVGDNGTDQAVIKTYPRRGFRFVADVIEEDKEHSGKSLEGPAKIDSVPEQSVDARSMADLAQPLLLPNNPTVAVLPLENLSGNPEQEFFVDGLTEDIITALSLWRSFPVVARHSTFAYKGTSPDIRKVGEELGARYIIEGSVRRSGDRVRVTAQLVDAETGHQVWAERYDRAIDDFFELQDEIADRIAAIIQPALVKAEGRRIAAKRPADLAAWEYCLRGFAHLQNYNQEDTILAREMFESALAIDPEYGRAYAGIAYAHIQDYRFLFTDDLDETRRAMFDAARRAIALDDTNSQAHMMLARSYSLVHDEERAIGEARRALDLNPHDTDAQVWLGSLLAFWSEPEEGVPLLERGLELNPLEPRIFNFMAHLSVAYLCLGQYETAVHWGYESTRRNPNFFESHVNLASALGFLGRADEARELLKQFDASAQEDVARRQYLHREVKDRLINGLRKAGLHA